jgi:hypothetical protein
MAEAKALAASRAESGQVLDMLRCNSINVPKTYINFLINNIISAINSLASSDCESEIVSIIDLLEYLIPFNAILEGRNNILANSRSDFSFKFSIDGKFVNSSVFRRKLHEVNNNTSLNYIFSIDTFSRVIYYNKCQ